MTKTPQWRDKTDFIKQKLWLYLHLIKQVTQIWKIKTETKFLIIIIYKIRPQN